MDLMQEKNIKQLKKMSQKRNATFGGAFFKQVVAVNIREFLAAMTSTNAFVGLVKRGGTHHRVEKTAVTQQLAQTLKERHLHEFCQGRETQQLASDDFDVGQRRLENTNRIKDFVERTILDAGAIHGVEEEDAPPSGIVLNPDSEIEVPHMLIDGQFVVGDENEMDADDDDELGDTVL